MDTNFLKRTRHDDSAIRMLPPSQGERQGAERTSAIELSFTNHGRQRQIERRIPERDIQAAIKYGEKIHTPDPNLVIYIHDGMKHILQKGSNRVISTMATSIRPKYKTLTADDKYRHERAYDLIHHRQPAKCDREYYWKSHSVLIVDRSGSMRNSDVSGCRTRLGSVWLSIAQDFVNHRLESGVAGEKDVVTIILMGESATPIIDKWPTDKVLYNRIVDLYFDSERADVLYSRGFRCDPTLIRPKGHGCYGPSLERAERIFLESDDTTSILQLLILSDGRPSDNFIKNNPNANTDLRETVGGLASKYGQRFIFSAIGIGNMKDYDCLKNMSMYAKEYGAHQSSFQVPALSCAAIGAAISSVATSLTLCQSKLNDDTNRTAKRVRSCYRESTKSIPILTEWVDSSEFDIYLDNQVQRYEYCSMPDGSKNFVSVPLIHDEAKGVAIKRIAFGEGSERLAFQFFEVAEDGSSVVGEPLVAKKSRFLADDEIYGDESTWESKDRFAKRFCKVQAKARDCSNAFNNKLDSIPSLDPGTVRVSFIDCHVYYLPNLELGDYAVVVEQKLEGRFEKWNNNNGWMKESTPKVNRRERAIEINHRYSLDRIPMHAIAEDEDEEAGANEVLQNVVKVEDHDVIVIDDDGVIDLTGLDEYVSVTKNEVAQAFSHFSYIHSGKKMLICDLQGVYDKKMKLFKWTDPVIHYHNPTDDSTTNKRGRHGRTDMGQKGIQNFFKSHRCNALCDLVCKGFIPIS